MVHSYFNVYGFFLLDFSMHSILCAMSAFLMFRQSEDLLWENVHTETMPYSLRTHTRTHTTTQTYFAKKGEAIMLVMVMVYRSRKYSSSQSW